MSDREQSISLAFVAGETLAAAHFLRGVSAHLTALGRTLPLPTEDVQDVVFESDAEEAFAAFPALDLFTDWKSSPRASCCNSRAPSKRRQ